MLPIKSESKSSKQLLLRAASEKQEFIYVQKTGHLHTRICTERLPTFPTVVPQSATSFGNLKAEQPANLINNEQTGQTLLIIAPNVARSTVDLQADCCQG